MPGMDGIEVCRRLKADVDLRSIPVILVSALHKEEDLVRGLDAGGQDYIIKPFNNRIVNGARPVRRPGKGGVRLIAKMNVQLERGLERIAALRRIDQAINTTFDLRLTLDLVLAQVMTQLGSMPRRAPVRPSDRHPGVRDGQGIPHRRDDTRPSLPGPERGRQGRPGTPVPARGRPFPEQDEICPAEAMAEEEISAYFRDAPGGQGPDRGGPRDLPPLPADARLGGSCVPGRPGRTVGPYYQ